MNKIIIVGLIKIKTVVYLEYSLFSMLFPSGQSAKHLCLSGKTYEIIGNLT